MKTPSALQKLRSRFSLRKRSSSSRMDFTKRSDSAPSCLHDVDMRRLNKAIRGFVQPPNSITLPPQSPVNPRVPAEPIRRTSLNTLRIDDKMRHSIASPDQFILLDDELESLLADLETYGRPSPRATPKRNLDAASSTATREADETCEKECLPCALVRPELKRRRHSAVIDPSFYRTLDFWDY